MSDYARNLAAAAREASGMLVRVSGQTRIDALRRAADALRGHRRTILEANAQDLEAAQQAALAMPLVKRLELSESKVESMAGAVEQIAAQVDPVGQVIEGSVRPNGLRISKVRVPIGVVLFIYESRPNVTSDAAALCIKSGNAVILRGGKEAIHSNRAIATAFAAALGDAGLPPASVQLVESTDRTLVTQLLKLDSLIDLVIPRGGESLIRAVAAESTIPVLKHFTGNCHVYIDAATAGMADAVRRVCVNAKTGYPLGAVCNAAETLLFHRAAAGLVAPVCADLAERGVEIRGDEEIRRLFPSAKPATEEDWAKEYLDLIIAARMVESLDEAIAHINRYGSRHTDAILTCDIAAAERFVREVDSASVIVNASTRFSDGGEYGLGAEIGISTDKLHARGPMGAADLTTYKWIVHGDGHIR